MSGPRSRPHLAIVGAGPTGIEAALAALDAGLPFTLLERSEAVAGHIREWGHVRLFTPWSMNVSPRMTRHLERAGQRVPGEGDEGAECPTGAELARRLLQPLAELPGMAHRLETDARVVAIGRDGLLKQEEIATDRRASTPFRLLVVDGAGNERVMRADVVLDCTGTRGNPNTTGDGGIPAPGERALGDSIVRAIPDFGPEAGEWAGRRTLLVGSGHSAQTAARELAALAANEPTTEVVWAVKGDDAVANGVPDDPLPERGSLTAAARALAAGDSPFVRCRSGVVVEALHPRPGAAERGGATASLRSRDGSLETLEVDRVLSLTGSVGDHGLYRQLQVHECYATAGPMKLSAALLADASADCLEQAAHGAETLRNPEPGFFIVGEKSYGRNPTFLMRAGWRQIEEVFGLIS